MSSDHYYLSGPWLHVKPNAVHDLFSGTELKNRSDTLRSKTK